ncbi:hypothetical protein KP509_1Z311600 [Ceratopteris richardii]|nr:hypothetical protein KP509_1Z311600 [Ceratopteris richardii]
MLQVYRGCQALQKVSGAVRVYLKELMKKRSSNRSEDLERTDAVPQEVSSNVPLVKPVGSAQLKDRMMLHVDDDTTTIESLEEKNVVHKALKKSSVTKENPEFEALQHEVFELRKENGNFRKLLKETEQKLNSLSDEKVLWEQQKLSEMSSFNAFKESEVNGIIDGEDLII